jgi:2-polyprenyl-3-methyl-5-hydroxy-6-metoxy-1,4-benzoquinol methylase
MNKLVNVAHCVYGWPASMLKDAILYCLYLQANQLDNHGKSFLNECFSVICAEKNKYLQDHILAALLMMEHKKFTLAREFLKNHSECHKEWHVCLDDFLNETKDALTAEQITQIQKTSLDLQKLKNESVSETTIQKLIAYLTQLDVIPSTDLHPYKKDGYTSYYKQKKEEFSLQDRSSWLNKQKNIFSVLQEFKPGHVLDLGANTGWFSLLAESLGSKVIATDIDEAVLDCLYQSAQHDGLNILPLLVPFETLLQVNVQKKASYVIDFLQSDLVLCLALVHHLVFLSGLSIDQIFEVLVLLTKNVLVLEYVASDDEVIQKTIRDPSSIKDEKIRNRMFERLDTYIKENYTLTTFLNEGKKHFSSVKILDSHPYTRKLLVFVK